MSVITFQCPACGRAMKVPEAAAGKRGTCKDCGELVMVPSVLHAMITTPRLTPATVVATPASRSPDRIEPATAIQVNVSHPQAPETYGLGVTSIVFGLLAMFVAWVPILGLVGLPFALAGMSFGATSLAISAFRQNKGIWYGAAGSACSLLSVILIWLTWQTMFPAWLRKWLF